MITDIVDFTPWSALGGGLMIGLAALLLLAVNGRIAGVAGILHGISRAADRGWRLAFLAGLVAGAALYLLLFPGTLAPREGFPLPLLAVAGLLVGAGTRLGAGCTSGHGVCGIARWSPRSLVATGVFMAVGVGAAGGRHEGAVPVAEFGGEPVGLGEREGRQVAPDLERGGAGLAGHAELAESAERSQERGVPAAVEPEADGRRRVGEVEVEAGGFGVESVGESAQ